MAGSSSCADVRLQDVATGPGAQCRGYDVALAVRADEQDARTWVGGDDTSRRLEAVHRRQLDVQQNEIRLHRRGLRDGVDSIDSFPDNLPLTGVLDQRAQLTAPRLMIVDHEHTPFACRCSTTTCICGQRGERAGHG